MDIIVEDGTGLPTANSYIAVADAVDLLSTNMYATFGTLDPTVQANLLMWASRVLDERVRWHGHKFQPTSGLAWPRFNVRDREGCHIDWDVVPQAVKTATAILANHFVTAGADPDAADTTINLTSLKVDVISFTYDPKILKERWTPEIQYILDGLGWVSMGRGGPKYIVRH